MQNGGFPGFRPDVEVADEPMNGHKRFVRIRMSDVHILSRCLTLCLATGVLLVTVSFGRSLPADEPGPSSLEQNPEGWSDLLESAGPKLDGWIRGPIPPQGKVRALSQWSVDPATGHLVCQGDGGHEWLRWDKELGDFIFHVEWQFTRFPEKKGYNSGIYARNSADARIWHQAQTGDRSGGFLFGETSVNGRLRGLNLAKQQPASRVKPAGEWNTFEITCKGREMSLWVNGSEVNRWRECEVPTGYVGLEAEGYRIEFRSLKIKPLGQSRADTSAGVPSGIQVGAALRTITPTPLLPVSGGMGVPKPAREKRGDLTARALVIRKGNVSVAVVALDLLGFPSVLGDRVRTRVIRIPARNILIGSTHTHSAPDCYAFPDGQGGHTGDLKYMEFVCEQAAAAVNEAIDHLQPASIKVATGEARGKIAYNYYAPDLYDRRMSVIQANGPQGKTIATLVNYAVHPEVLGNEVGVLSPDLVGPLCEKLEAQSGGVALFLNSAQGGMVTADNRNLDAPRDPLRGYWNDSRTWEECMRIGHLMADEALRIVRDAPEQKNPSLFCEAISLRFPVDSPTMWGVIMGSPLNYPHNADHSVNARINLVNLGDAQILTIPGEALPNIGFYLKRKMRGKHNLLFGLTNEAFGYILTKVDFQSFPRYDYVSRTSLGELTGEILIERALEFVARSPLPDQ
jgi:hypothetical protein